VLGVGGSHDSDNCGGINRLFVIWTREKMVPPPWSLVIVMKTTGMVLSGDEDSSAGY
jgi:hypothetical protein